MKKMSLGEDGVKGLFVRHVEKFVFGIVVVLFGVLLYTGFSQEAFDKSPVELARLADEAVRNVNNESSWDSISQKHQPKMVYRAAVETGRRKTNADDYPLANPLAPQFLKAKIKREDPKLLPAIKIETYAVTGAFAYRYEEEAKDPWENDKDMVQEPEKKKPVQKKKRRVGGMGSSAMPGMPGMPGGAGGEEMESMGSMGSMSGMPGMPGMPGSGEMGGGYGAMGGTEGPVTTANTFKGYRPTSPATVRAASIVAVKALVPYEEEFDEYDHVLKEAVGYDGNRDIPRYVFFYAQRADVTDDPNKVLEEADWDPNWKMNPNRMMQAMQEWHGVSPELADPRYLMPGVLTMPLPPLMMEDPEKLAMHSEIPRMMAAPKLPAADEKKNEKEEEEPSDSPDSPFAARPNQGMPGMGMPGMGSSMPGMGSSMPGMGMPGMGSSMPGMGSSMPGMGMPGMGSESTMGESMAGSMPGMGMPGMPGSSGMPGMGSYGTVARSVVKYQLVRFFDTEAEPGRKYRYRIQLVLEDPNHPQNPLMDPPKRSMSDNVVSRLKDLEAKEAKAKGRRQYFVSSPWSEPSEVVSVSYPAKVLAGVVTAPKTIALAPTEDFALAEPKGKVMAIGWEPTRAVKVPGVQEVGRGAYLNFHRKVDVIHPLTLVFKTITDFEFNANSLLLDMRGGEPIPGGDKAKPLLVPGEYLIMDAKGQLVVRNELDDVEEFKSFLPPEKLPLPGAAAGEGSDSADMPGGYPGGMPGMSMPGMGMPGEGGGSRRGGNRRGNNP